MDEMVGDINARDKTVLVGARDEIRAVNQAPDFLPRSSKFDFIFDK